MNFNKILQSLFGNKSTRDMKLIQPIVEKIKAEYPKMQALSNDELRAKTKELQKYVQEYAKEEKAKIAELKAKIEDTPIDEREGIFNQIDKLEQEALDKYEVALNEVLPQVFAIVKDTARRFAENEETIVTATDFDRELASNPANDFVTIDGDKAIYHNHWTAGGNDMKWEMIHYDVQLFGGVVLHQGKIAEMATGEGKTLVGTTPIFLNALTGNGVHVVTVNDYLAKRDSEWMGPLYMFHGLSVDCIDKHRPNSDERRKAYLADITFGTNNEFGFDYLRDNMATNPADLVQRQHNYAIVDEVDSVLIDDARTPLIISGPIPKGDDQMFEQYQPLVEKLYEVQRKQATELLAEAKQKITEGTKAKNQELLDEGFLALFRSYKALPKNKPLIKYLSEEGIKAGLLKTEEYYMANNNREMPKATEPLYFVVDAEDFIWSNENAVTIDVDDTLKSKYYLKWSTAYKEACKLIYDKQSKFEDFKKAEQLLLSESQLGNVLAIHDLGKLYSTEKLDAKDEEKSFAYYREALQGFVQIEPDSDFMFPYEPKYEGQIMKPVDMRSYVWYRIGKMHCYRLGTEQDYAQAFDWFLKSAQEGNKFAQYSLANLYYYGKGAEKDLSQAFFWYRKSAVHGQPYASYAVAQMYNKGEYVSQSEEVAQRYYKKALLGFLKLESKNQADDNLYYKLGSVFKKGLGTDINMDKAIDYFKRSAEMNNKNGLYEYGKALLLGEHIPQDKDKAVKLLEKAIELNNINSKRFLSLEYISGEHLEQYIEKGLDMLTECADGGDTFACYKLGRIYFKGEIVLQDLDKAEKYLLSAEDNEFTQYALGKLYLQKEKYDIQKAIDYFEKSADKNYWSSYQLGRLYLFGAEELEKDKGKAVEWLTKSANDGNEYVQNMLDNMEQFENAMLVNTIFSLFANLSRCIEDDYMQKYKSVKRTVSYENGH